MAATPRQIYLNQKEANPRIFSHIGDVYEGLYRIMRVRGNAEQRINTTRNGL
jgi:hypothetical protein